MSAAVNEVYNAYCPDCNEGAGPFDDSDDADAWVNKHNAEHHSAKGIIRQLQIAAWDHGFSDGMRQWELQRKDPTHPITRTNPYEENP